MTKVNDYHSQIAREDILPTDISVKYFYPCGWISANVARADRILLLTKGALAYEIEVFKKPTNHQPLGFITQTQCCP